MRQHKLFAVAALVAVAVFSTACGSAKIPDDSPDIFPSSVEKSQAKAAIDDAQNAYNALPDDGSGEKRDAKSFLDKAKEYLSDGEPEAAWSAATKSKSFSSLAAEARKVRAAGLQ
ncbi:MAG TPA: hypothetical protein PLY93_14385 [Turneriella sp.]|nr:hypothetical protein [Turneriella sp.]